MKKNLLLLSIFFFTGICFPNLVSGQGKPEILYYKFNNTGKSIRNLASSPPSGTSYATINGSLSQGSTGACGGTALVGSGNLSSTDYVDTKWATSTSGSWTISFWTNGLDSSTTLFYLFSDLSASALRCFSGGVAGAGNLLLRGPFTEVLITGGASKKTSVSTFVYDAGANNIYAYLNGSLVNTVAQSSISLSSTGTFILSGYNSLNGLNSGGLMDEFRFYSHALTSSEVAKLSYTGNTSGSMTASAKCSYTGPSGYNTWNRTGTYKDTISNYNNCDSIITVNLTITGNTSKTISATSCDFYVSPSKNFVWGKTGTYTDVLKNKAGCDSILTINLTIKNSTTKTLTVKQCGSYKGPSGKHTWTLSGQYQDTIPNKKGCDSLITINLTIGKANAHAITVKTCDKYRSPSGKRTWTSSGIYKDTLMNSSGCDSLLTINLTINKSTTNSISVKVCNKYISPSGKTNWVASGTYLDTIVNRAGCDSVITVKLTLNKTAYMQVYPVACEKYTSPSGKYSTTVSNSFYDTIPSAAGCDSIILIEVTINSKTTHTMSKSVCKRYVSPSGKKTWTVSGKYFDTIPNRKGCDSIITINLTVNVVNVGVTQKNAKLTAVASGAIYQWLDCNNGYNPIPGATNQLFTALGLGKYAVKVTEGLCTDTSTCYNVTNLGINKNILNDYLSVYPNPATGLFTISSGKPLSSATLKVINAMGEVIIEKSALDGTSFILDISGQANGIYFIEIEEQGNSGRIRLIKY